MIRLLNQESHQTSLNLAGLNHGWILRGRGNIQGQGSGQEYLSWDFFVSSIHSSGLAQEYHTLHLPCQLGQLSVALKHVLFEVESILGSVVLE